MNWETFYTKMLALTESIKKILCCASAITDRLEADQYNPERLVLVAESKEYEDWVNASDALAAKWDTLQVAYWICKKCRTKNEYDGSRVYYCRKCGERKI